MEAELLATYARCATRDALIGAGEVETHLTYSTLAQQVKALQQTLQSHGINRGTIVAAVFPNSMVLALVFLALLACDATIAPLDPKLKADEYKYDLEDLRIDFVLAPSNVLSSENDLTAVTKSLSCGVLACAFGAEEVKVDVVRAGLPHPNSSSNRDSHEPTALILHTSGTTGKPKIVPLTAQNLLASTHNVIETYNLSKDDRTILLMPLFHIHGIVAGFLAPLLCGAGLVIPERGLAGDFWELYMRHGANWWTATPTHHRTILQLKRPPEAKVRFIRSCSSALSPIDAEKLEEALQAPVLQAYAMTENAHHISSTKLGEPREPGTVGFPPSDLELSILDEADNTVPPGQVGQVAIKGASSMNGYRNNEEANEKSFTSSGLFKTGDQGKLDEEGCLTLTGRLKEMINKGGETISPTALDSVLLNHSAIKEAVAFAVPDDVFGEDIGVAVVLEEHSSLSRAELVEWMRERVAEAKVPRTIWFVDHIPKTATGKLQRIAVAREMLQSPQEQPK
ncbi:hypothetical protein BAUCODRAFT_78982, partial [Baudoinia panamericana UAMH 10762]